MAEERLQKILARAGVTSRRKAEALITAGRVRVDGRVVSELGAKANPKKCSIELDGKKLEPEPLCYGVFHKPRGMVTTLSDPEGRPTAQDVLRKVGVRVVPVGRLDFNTSGALLFTNDGDFAQALQHARGKAPKVYSAKVTRPIDEANLGRWAQSIQIEGKETNPASVRILRRDGDKTWLEVTIMEGRNRQVRRLGDHAGTPVERLARLSHAGISTEGLRPGEWRLLTIDELKTMKKSYGVPEKLRGLLDGPRGPQGGGAPRPAPRRRAGESGSTEAPSRARSEAQKTFGGARPAATRARPFAEEKRGDVASPPRRGGASRTAGGGASRTAGGGASRTAGGAKSGGSSRAVRGSKTRGAPETSGASGAGRSARAGRSTRAGGATKRPGRGSAGRSQKRR